MNISGSDRCTDGDGTATAAWRDVRLERAGGRVRRLAIAARHDTTAIKHTQRHTGSGQLQPMGAHVRILLAHGGACDRQRHDLRSHQAMSSAGSIRELHLSPLDDSNEPWSTECPVHVCCSPWQVCALPPARRQGLRWRHLSHQMTRHPCADSEPAFDSSPGAGCASPRRRGESARTPSRDPHASVHVRNNTATASSSDATTAAVTVLVVTAAPPRCTST